MNIIINVASLGLCVKQTFMDSTYNDDGELVFGNFSVIVKSLNCFKLFVTAYPAVHTEGSEIFGFVCLLGFFLVSYAISAHLNRNHKAWARIWIVGMATLMAAAAFFLCRGMVIPEDHVWHTTAVPAIIILILCLEAGLFVCSQINEDGVNQNLLRGLKIKFAEESICIYRCVDLVEKTRNPWEAEKTLHLVGSGLSVLIGAFQIGWMVYKAGTISMVVAWLRKIIRAFTGEEEQAARAAMDGGGDGDGEKVVEEGLDVVVASPA